MQHDVCQRQGIPLLRAETREELRDMAPAELAADLWVDAVFGTGLSRPVEGVYEEAVAWLSSGLAPVIAIDLPSGLDASLGDQIGPAATADVTVALGSLKRAHVLRPAAVRCGRGAGRRPGHAGGRSRRSTGLPPSVDGRGAVGGASAGAPGGPQGTLPVTPWWSEARAARPERL